MNNKGGDVEFTTEFEDLGSSLELLAHDAQDAKHRISKTLEKNESLKIYVVIQCSTNQIKSETA